MGIDDNYKIDGTTAQRLDLVMRKVLQPGGRTGGGVPNAQPQDETCYAKITSQVDEDQGTWAWSEVYWQINHDGTSGQWVVKAGGRSSSDADDDGTDDTSLAFEALNVSGSVNDYFMLRRLPTLRLADPGDDTSTDEPEVNWCLAAPLPGPTKKYQVLTPIDDTLRPVWTTARFTDDT